MLAERGKCRICKIVLTKDNSYYPKQSILLCKKHFLENVIKQDNKYIKKYSLSEKGKTAINRASKNSYIKHKEKWLARAKARYAVSKGVLIKPSKCEVCERKVALQGHHEDYTKPLEVIWLCSKCHAEADRLLEKRLPS